MDEMKKYRFFFHYRKSTGGMTVHFKGICYPCIDVECLVPIETKRNNVQPRLVLQGFCSNIEKQGNKIIIK